MYYTESVTITVIKKWREVFMDISNRNPQSAGTSGHTTNHGPATDRANSNSGNNNKPVNKSAYAWYRVGVMAAVLAVAVILVGLSLLIYSNTNDTKDTESSYIKTSKLQAVFLNTGQVYFGNINTLNNNFLVLSNIFYLQTTSSGSSTTATSASSSASNVTLVKLGCELHMPYDQMIINRSQVTFWENLQSNGQVAKAVISYEQQHPNGQQCTDQSSSSGSTSSSVQNAGSTSGNTTKP
jgi:hypothetical protein